MSRSLRRGGPGMVMMVERWKRDFLGQGPAVSMWAAVESRCVSIAARRAADASACDAVCGKRASGRTDSICGRYEGIDERLIRRCVDEEISIGDFVLSGGEIPQWRCWTLLSGSCRAS